jgi:hypothetical protein
MAQTRRHNRRKGGARPQRPRTNRKRSAIPRGSMVSRTAQARNETIRPKSTRVAQLTLLRRLRPITELRTTVLAQQRTSKIPRQHRFVTEAKSPEVLHAVITRLASLPSQPILHFSVAPGTDLNIQSTINFSYPTADIQRNAGIARIGFVNPDDIDEDMDEDLKQQILIQESLNPTGLIHITDGDDNDNNGNNNDNNDNNNDENNDGQNGGGAAKETFEATLASVYVNPVLASAVRDDYAGVEKMDIPIYFVIHANIPGGGHMSIIVIYRTVVYSIGFGYSGKLRSPKAFKFFGKEYSVQYPVPASVVGKASLYNPDYIINPKVVFTHKDTGVDTVFKYRIIDFGYLKPVHLQRIVEISAQNQGLGLITYDGTFDTTFIPLNTQYHMASSAAVACILKGAMNCTTFVEYIFREKVKCKIAGIVPVSYPKSCNRIQGKLTNEKIKTWFAEYNSEAPMYTQAMHAFLGA